MILGLQAPTLGIRRKQAQDATETQKIPSRVSPTKWAHLTEKTDVQSPGTDIHKMGAHLPVSRTKGGARGGTRGLADCGSAGPMSAPSSLIFGGKFDPIHSKAVHYVSIFIDGGN